VNIEIQGELSMLRERYPDKAELTLTEYTDYFGITRHYATQHIKKNNIPHKRIGKSDYRFSLKDLSLWLAQQKVINGRPLALTSEDLKRKRGFCK